MKTIGIDIDGVLNDHCIHFCDVIYKLTKKIISPADIVSIPVHKIDNLNVSLNEEMGVFHDISYWEDMPPSINDFSFLSTVKSRMKIYIFTNRDWPQKKYLIQNKKLRDSWNNTTIRELTINWLARHKIPYDKLYIERKTSVLKFLNSKNNRNEMARNNKIHYFVEDNYQNAEKLALYCSKVFLVRQPYNANLSFNSDNIIRVNDIQEIINYI